MNFQKFIESNKKEALSIEIKKDNYGYSVWKKYNLHSDKLEHSEFESEAITVKDGALVLNKHAHSSSFGNQTLSLNSKDLKKNKGILEIQQLVNYIANSLQGQYNDEYQSMAQRYVVGKMVMGLRKWIVRGFNNRWRGGITARRKKEALTDKDRFFSEDFNFHSSPISGKWESPSNVS